MLPSLSRWQGLCQLHTILQEYYEEETAYFYIVQVNHYKGIVMNEFVSEAQKQSRMLADKEKDWILGTKKSKSVSTDLVKIVLEDNSEMNYFKLFC